MTQAEKEALASAIQNLSSKIDKDKPSRLVDWGMRIAATVSTAGILAVFALFFTTIPELKQSVERVSWETAAMKEKLDVLGSEPRFTLKDYNLEEREQRSSMSDMKAKLDIRGNWMDNIDDKMLGQEYRIRQLEKKLKIDYDKDSK